MGHFVFREASQNEELQRSFRIILISFPIYFA